MQYVSMSVNNQMRSHRTDGETYIGRCDYDLIPYEPYSDYVIDDKVYVKDYEEDGDPWPCHFAGLDINGRPTVFCHGFSSFTTSGETVAFNFCEKADKEDK